MIEKSLFPAPGPEPGPEPEGEVELDIEILLPVEEGEVIELEVEAVDSFGDNLAEVMEDSELNTLSSDLLDFYMTDITSRADWEQTYRDGLGLLGLKIEDRTEPWMGACGITHPLLSEAVVRFQSETIMETFPASGPVKTKIIGRMTREKQDSAERVRDDMNHWLTDRMPDYRGEYERLLWSLPLAGTALKKVYYDSDQERPVVPFVPAEDFIISYGAVDLISAPRYAHRMKKTSNELRKLQVSGFYRDIDIGDPVADADDMDEAKDDLTGHNPLRDDRFTVLEYHIDLDLPGFEDPDGIDLPYVVHMVKDSGQILAVYRNWDEDDLKKRKRVHFIKYGYIPGFGFYDFGLIHLLGGFAKGATSILRQLVDSGTLANLPGGLKSRGLRIKGDDNPIAPGEFRDVDVPSGSIRDNILPLPYKEPSEVLYRLLGDVIGEARRFAAMGDVNVGDLQPNAPVGSVLAVLERTLKTMSAIQARVHAAMKAEFALLKGIIREHTTPDYEYDPDGLQGSHAKQTDYDVVDIIPVSDPNATTLSQRIAQYQAALQLAMTSPEIYNMPELHRQMLDVLGIRNAERILPDREKVSALDPVSENMALLNGTPIRAFLHQDHEAHIATHLAFGRDPMIQQTMQANPKAQAIAAAGMAHIAEHLAFQYRRQIEEQLGVPLPPPEEALPEDVEVELSRLVAQAADKLLQKSTTQASQEQAQQQAQDPIVQMQMEEVQIKKGDLQRKAQKDQMDFHIEQAKLEIEREKMDSSERRTDVQAGARLASENLRTDAKEKADALKMAVDIATREAGGGV